MRALLPTLLLQLLSCQEGLTDPAKEPELDEAFFRCRVQPVVTKSCGMFGCHGDPERYFTVYGRNRLRIDEGDESQRNAFLTDEERAVNFAAASALVDPKHPEDSVLLLKALDQEAGGWFHRGSEIFGQGDVFLDPEEPDYQVILAWVSGEKEDPLCIEPGSAL